MKAIFIICTLLTTQAFASFYSNGSKVPASKVDVLVLMDNSGSMTKYAKTIGGTMAALINQLDYTNFNVGLITNGPFKEGESPFKTTPVNGSLNDVLVGLMKDISDLGYDGSATEEFYSAILKTTEPKYSSFYRENSDVVIYLVTDEDEERVKAMMNTFDFIREFKSRLNLGKVTFNLLTESQKCKNFGPAIQDMVLYEAVRALGGNVYDLCPQE
jgi:hypothetical protein